jgi:uncharacterized membrane protein YfcA
MDPAVIQAWLLPVAVAGIAFLYSSVGHGGATGYLAIAALVGLAPGMARPGALWMNCVVAGIAFWRFRQAGCFDAKVFWPLAIASIPCAWLGSQMHLDGRSHALVLALVLLAAGVMLARRRTPEAHEQQRPLAWPLAVIAGAVLGLLAGLTGIGGGVFLTPLLILLHWTPSKVAGGISALFIVVNSMAGLLGLGASALVWQPLYLVAIALGIVGALLGTQLSLKHWHAYSFHRALAAVLWIAAGKLALTGK